MKRILLVILVIAAIPVIAAIVFISTFDINNYKGALESRLSILTGNPVEIGKLSLGWKGGVRIGIDGLKIRSGSPAGPAALSVDRAEAGVDLAPILTRKLQISSIHLVRPEIGLVRNKEGRVELRGYSPKSDVASVPAAAAPAAFGFSISFIRISDGTIRYTDMSDETPSELVIKKIDANIRDVSMTTPVKFDVKAAVAGERRNVSASGIAGGWLAGRIFLKDFNLEADLAAFGHVDIVKAIPSLGRIGLKEGLAGVVSARIRSLETSGEKMTRLSGEISIKDGNLVLTGMRVPIERIYLDMSAEEATLTVRSFAARIGAGAIKAAARIDDAFSSPRTALELGIEIKGLGSFLSEVAGIRQNLDGNARIVFGGTFSGGAWPEISRTISGRGTFSLDQGIIMDANVLDQTIGALTVFPTLVDSMQGTAPEPEKRAMAEKYTVLKPLTQSYTIEGGYIIIPDLTLQSDYVDMSGEAKMSLAGDLSGSGMIKFSQNISGSMLKVVPQMKAITDPQGLVTFPINFKGGGGTFKVIPDMKYIGRKVAVQTAGDAVSGYLKKAMDASGSAQPSGAAPGSESGKPPKIKDFLKALANETKK